MNHLWVSISGIIAAYAVHAYPLSIGDTAPDFTATTTSDSSFSLAQYQGQVRVLYFLCFG
jgi:peroxiredoxin